MNKTLHDLGFADGASCDWEDERSGYDMYDHSRSSFIRCNHPDYLAGFIEGLPRSPYVKDLPDLDVAREWFFEEDYDEYYSKLVSEELETFNANNVDVAFAHESTVEWLKHRKLITTINKLMECRL